MKRFAALMVGDGERFRPWGLYVGITGFLLMIGFGVADCLTGLLVWEIAGIGMAVLSLVSLLVTLAFALLEDDYSRS